MAIAADLAENNNVLEKLLKDLPDTPVASTFFALLEDQMILREQYKITQDLLKGVQKKLEVKDLPQEEVEKLRGEIRSIMSHFDDMNKHVTAHIQELREEIA